MVEEHRCVRKEGVGKGLKGAYGIEMGREVHYSINLVFYHDALGCAPGKREGAAKEDQFRLRFCGGIRCAS